MTTIVCTNCQADDLGCTACGALNTLEVTGPTTDRDTTTVLTELAADIDSQAAIASRAGQTRELELIAVQIRDVAARLAAQSPQDDPQLDEREALARAMEPNAFPSQPIELRSHAAALQWAVRRKIALDHADAVLAAGFRRDPDAGLRDRIQSLHRQPTVLASHSDLVLAYDDTRAALTGPAPGSETSCGAPMQAWGVPGRCTERPGHDGRHA